MNYEFGFGQLIIYFAKESVTQLCRSLQMHSFSFFSIALQMIDDILRGQNGGED